MSPDSNGQSTAFTVLVSSTDAFSDCWQPFFTLLDTYWPADWPEVVLVSETKTFRDPRVRTCVTGLPNKPRFWSDGILQALETVSTPYVLYMQEDYFLHGHVRLEVIREMVAWMARGGKLCLRLRETENSGPWRPCEDRQDVWRVLPESRYLVSLQAAIWRVDGFERLLVPGESPWDFEGHGSERARSSGIGVYCASRTRYRGDRLIVPYFPTGIVKGEWDARAVVELFERHEIEVDFSRRGFYEPPTRWTILRERLRKLASYLSGLAQ